MRTCGGPGCDALVEGRAKYCGETCRWRAWKARQGGSVGSVGEAFANATRVGRGAAVEEPDAAESSIVLDDVRFDEDAVPHRGQTPPQTLPTDAPTPTSSVRTDDFADGHALAVAAWGSPTAPTPEWDGERVPVGQLLPLAQGAPRDARAYRTSEAQARRDAALERRHAEANGEQYVDPGAPGAPTGAMEHRAAHALRVLEATIIRTEERLAELDAHASRLEACVRSAESLVRALGGHPGYGPPRLAVGRREEVPEDRMEDVEYPVDPVLEPDAQEPDAASDVAAATAGI